ncbi:hypothetical protein B0H11DRAFT_734224 [Mycena galericulata]|nr:hypothetical protein B0H11DRAFT_734224 [Mycena galericulata]
MQTTIPGLNGTPVAVARDWNSLHCSQVTQRWLLITPHRDRVHRVRPLPCTIQPQRIFLRRFRDTVLHNLPGRAYTNLTPIFLRLLNVSCILLVRPLMSLPNRPRVITNSRNPPPFVRPSMPSAFTFNSPAILLRRDTPLPPSHLSSQNTSNISRNAPPPLRTATLPPGNIPSAQTRTSTRASALRRARTMTSASPFPVVSSSPMLSLQLTRLPSDKSKAKALIDAEVPSCTRPSCNAALGGERLR